MHSSIRIKGMCKNMDIVCVCVCACGWVLLGFFWLVWSGGEGCRGRSVQVFSKSYFSNVLSISQPRQLLTSMKLPGCGNASKMTCSMLHLNVIIYMGSILLKESIRDIHSPCIAYEKQNGLFLFFFYSSTVSLRVTAPR